MSDDGPGIEPERIEAIFEKGVSSKGAERGVGLALVKQQVEALGGVISVESEHGIFTQFLYSYPGWRKDQPMINVPRFYVSTSKA